MSAAIKVWIVDDDESIRWVLEKALQRVGMAVQSFPGAAELLDAIQEDTPDVLICDIRMPKINGVEAIAYFRANYPRVPVIVLTGFPDADMATSMLRQGVVDYLVKPVEGEKLRESVARAMEQRELAHL